MNILEAMNQKPKNKALFKQFTTNAMTKTTKAIGVVFEDNNEYLTAKLTHKLKLQGKEYRHYKNNGIGNWIKLIVPSCIKPKNDNISHSKTITNESKINEYAMFGNKY